MSLWASARLSYGPCELAGVYAPMASVRRVVSASLFIRASMVRQGYGKSTLRALQGLSIYPRVYRKPLKRAQCRLPMVRQGYGKSTLRALQGLSIYPRIRVLLSRARGLSGSRSGRPSRARASCPGVLPQKEQEKPDRVHHAVCNDGHPEIATGDQVQEPEHKTAQPCGDHA